MSYIRSPIYVWGGVKNVHCSESKNPPLKHSLHGDKDWSKEGVNHPDIAFKHMAEHYRLMINDPETCDDAMLIHFHAWTQYIDDLPIIGWFTRRLGWRFDEKYGFVDDMEDE